MLGNKDSLDSPESGSGVGGCEVVRDYRLLTKDFLTDEGSLFNRLIRGVAVFNTLQYNH